MVFKTFNFIGSYSFDYSYGWLYDSQNVLYVIKLAIY